MHLLVSYLFLLFTLASLTPLSVASPPPIVLWHGLGDAYNNEGIEDLRADLESATGAFVYALRIQNDTDADTKASFFGDANEQVRTVWDQIISIPELASAELNPSREFDAIGFSQGGQLLRAVIERFAHPDTLSPRKLITLGSQHLGISALPPCPPGSSPFSTCRLMQSSLIRAGAYSSWAQHHIIPAQYLREPNRLGAYYSSNTFLKDINNERAPEDDTPRNATYRTALARLSQLVLIRFSDEETVVPPHTAHFTLPASDKKHCDGSDPSCYEEPLPWDELPLYYDDYIGLKALDQQGKVVRDICEGRHMLIDDDCWNKVKAYLLDTPVSVSTYWAIQP